MLRFYNAGESGFPALSTLTAKASGKGKGVQHVCLKRESDAEFDLTRRAQRVDAGSDTHTINIVTAVCSSVDLPHSARE